MNKKIPPLHPATPRETQSCPGIILSFYYEICGNYLGGELVTI